MLELGLEPIEVIIRKKRINYFHHLSTFKEQNIAKDIVLSQMKNPENGDWIETVKEDLNELKINQSIHEIKNLSKNVFKNHVKNAAKSLSLNMLLRDTTNTKKGKDVVHDALKMQEYLKSSANIKKPDMFNLLRLRTFNVNVKENSYSCKHY